MEKIGMRVAAQLVTTQDLIDFKVELFAELNRLLKDRTGAEKKWLKSREVRKLLNISPGKLQTLRSYGQIPFMRLGGVIYYDQSDIEKMLAEAKVQRNQYK